MDKYKSTKTNEFQEYKKWRYKHISTSITGVDIYSKVKTPVIDVDNKDNTPNYNNIDTQKDAE